MSQIDIFDTKGKQVDKVKLNDAIFNIKTNDKLIHQATVCQLANARQANAHTKTRGEVAGGGAKPWKQKGTGRARAGSSNSPIWIGGGTAFGPRNDRNYSLLINKKMKKKALLMVLSDKFSSKKLIVAKDLTVEEPKTKLLNQILDTLPTSDGTILIFLPEHNTNLELAAANLPFVKTMLTNGLNIIDILRYDYLLTTPEGLKSLESTFLGLDDTPTTDKQSENTTDIKDKKTKKDEE